MGTEYTPEVLYKVQQIQLNILRNIDELCRQHNIKYTLSGGTLLGAVRHQGFIPWDDDMDIDMLRPDYERFLKIASKELSSEYFVQNYKTDKYCLNAAFTKIRKNGTVFESEGQQHLKRHKGIGIDIFPIDVVPESLTKRKIHKELITFFQRVIAIKLKYNYYNEPIPKRLIKVFGSIVLGFIPVFFIGRLMNKIMRMYEHSESPLVANTYSKNVYDKLTFNKSVYGNPFYVNFWGENFPVPEKWEEVLSQFYGNYMIPPPENQRWNHQHKVIKVLLGKDK